MHVVIIGNGIAGVTAARHIRKRSDYRITMISDESWQPFSRTALMYVFMGQLKLESTYLYEDWFWDKNRIARVQARVQTVNPVAKNITLVDGRIISWDKLILATGSRPLKTGVPGENLPGTQHLYHLHDLDALNRMCRGVKHAVVVGGGLTGIELVEMLVSRDIKVTFLVRESGFMSRQITPEESDMAGRIIRKHGVDLRTSTQIREIRGNGCVESVVTADGTEIPCGLVGITIGVTPLTDYLAGSGIEIGSGVLVDKYLQTSVQDIYAAGDCAELRAPAPARRAVEPLWYTARAMGEAVAHHVCGLPAPYQQGIWHNSARFFDTEYPIYGHVPSTTPPAVRSLYWEHTSGKKSVRINYDLATGAVTGFQTMGIRYRHQICEYWIETGTHISDVLRNLSKANFDPEFYRRYEAQIASLFQQKISAAS